MSRSVKPFAKAITRTLSARELREQEYFQKINLQKIAAIDAYIQECEKRSGVTILEASRK